ncbi:MAG: SHOCT domain-containing protein [Corynebacteriales bacterium]|nr:SHOCT domain-containing protein [Mycobacteriales bacterium]
MTMTDVLAHGDRYHDGPPPFFFVGAIFQVLLIALVVVLIVRLIKARRYHGGFGHWRGYGPGVWTGPAHMAAADPARILAERYAKGEIDTAEYQEKARGLGIPVNPHDKN